MMPPAFKKENIMGKMNFDIKKTVTYKFGSTVMDMIDTMTEDKLSLKILFAENENMHKIEFFVDEVAKEKGIGFLSNNQEDVADKLRDILNLEASYSIALTGRKGNLLHAVMEWEDIVKKEVVVSDNKFTELKNDIVNAGFCKKEIIDRNIAIMEGNRVAGSLIEAVLKTYHKTNKPAHTPKTFYVDMSPKGVDSTIFNRCVYYALLRFPVIYEGDASVGKNVCAETVAAVFNEPYFLQTMNKSMMADDMYGGKSTDNSASNLLSKELARAYLDYQKGNPTNMDKAAEYEYLRAKSASISIVQELSCFVEWMQNGGVLVWNELNMAEANFFASFANQITDGTGFLDVPGVGRVSLNKNAILIGTQNADYTGVCDQNMATMSRFSCIQFPYPTTVKPQLQAVLGKDTLSDKYFTQADNYYKALLSAVHKGQVANSCLNIRGLVRALQAVSVIPGITKLTEQIQDQVINTCPVDDRPTLLAQLHEIVTL